MGEDQGAWKARGLPFIKFHAKLLSSGQIGTRKCFLMKRLISFLAATFCLLAANYALAHHERWGAVASGPSGNSAFTYDQISEDAARKQVIRDCGGRCDKIETFKAANDGIYCAAIAESKNRAWGWATGYKGDGYKKRARKNCRHYENQNKKSCKIKVWACNSVLAGSEDFDFRSNTRKEIQKALNHFGFNAGVADGIFGNKTKIAIKKIQMCWNSIAVPVEYLPKFNVTGKLNDVEIEYLLSEYNKSLSFGGRKTGCGYFSSKHSPADLKQCMLNGASVEPLFYCSFKNGKTSVKICPIYLDGRNYCENAVCGDDAMLYAYGKIGGEPDLELPNYLKNGFLPVADNSFSKEHVMAFVNGEYRYKIHGYSSPSPDRGWEEPNLSGELIVSHRVKPSNLYDDLATLKCDQGSIINTVYDGRVSATLQNKDLCFVAEEGDFPIGWHNCGDLEVLTEASSTGYCSLEDEIALRNSGYDGLNPEMVFRFGEKVKRIVSKNNMAEFYETLSDVLIFDGSAISKSDGIDPLIMNLFGSVVGVNETGIGFGEKWKEPLLADAISCRPVGTNGFMLAGGRLWYDFIDDDWRIIALNSGD